ncbi:hypothetical protein MO973_21530 [Paenibacillus sp. TRM 82003]|nr:hypothetical protein [Paenibacillus sp. TRM 82003]
MKGMQESDSVQDEIRDLRKVVHRMAGELLVRCRHCVRFSDDACDEAPVFCSKPTLPPTPHVRRAVDDCLDCGEYRNVT